MADKPDFDSIGKEGMWEGGRVVAIKLDVVFCCSCEKEREEEKSIVV